jgi:hypothetical protein
MRNRTITLSGRRGRSIRRPEPLDADASVLEQVASEIRAAASTTGDWPHGVITRGRVLVWASGLASVASHLREALGDELEATEGWLRRTAAQLRGHAEGLRGTGEWTPVVDEVDESADTRRMTRDETDQGGGGDDDAG